MRAQQMSFLIVKMGAKKGYVEMSENFYLEIIIFVPSASISHYLAQVTHGLMYGGAYTWVEKILQFVTCEICFSVFFQYKARFLAFCKSWSVWSVWSLWSVNCQLGLFVVPTLCACWNLFRQSFYLLKTQ